MIGSEEPRAEVACRACCHYGRKLSGGAGMPRRGAATRSVVGGWCRPGDRWAGPGQEAVGSQGAMRSAASEKMALVWGRGDEFRGTWAGCR